MVLLPHTELPDTRRPEHSMYMTKLTMHFRIENVFGHVLPHSGQGNLGMVCLVNLKFLVEKEPEEMNDGNFKLVEALIGTAYTRQGEDGRKRQEHKIKVLLQHVSVATFASTLPPSSLPTL